MVDVSTRNQCNDFFGDEEWPTHHSSAGLSEEQYICSDTDTCSYKISIQAVGDFRSYSINMLNKFHRIDIGQHTLLFSYYTAITLCRLKRISICWQHLSFGYNCIQRPYPFNSVNSFICHSVSISNS